MIKLKITCECQEEMTIPVSMLGKEIQWLM